MISLEQKQPKCGIIRHLWIVIVLALCAFIMKIQSTMGFTTSQTDHILEGFHRKRVWMHWPDSRKCKTTLLPVNMTSTSHVWQSVVSYCYLHIDNRHWPNWLTSSGALWNFCLVFLFCLVSHRELCLSISLRIQDLYPVIQNRAIVTLAKSMNIFAMNYATCIINFGEMILVCQWINRSFINTFVSFESRFPFIVHQGWYDLRSLDFGLANQSY